MYEAYAVGPQIIFGFLVFWFLVFGFSITPIPIMLVKNQKFSEIRCPHYSKSYE